MSRNTEVGQGLRRLADQLPGGDNPVVQHGREQVARAVEIASAALRVDPTLAELDRCRDLDLLAELLRQLKPLGKQAQLAIEHARLTAAAAPVREMARLGRINPQAPQEYTALAAAAVEVAERAAAAALPDWNTPARIQARSQRLLDLAYVIRLAEDLEHHIRPAVELAYPCAAAGRLAELAQHLRAAADQRRPPHQPPRRPPRCAGPGCGNALVAADTGRPRLYCGSTCRQRARRARRTPSPAS